MTTFHYYRGRVALHAVLRELRPLPGDEVVVQAYTCAAVVEPLLRLGLRPVYVDIDLTTYTMNPDLLRAALTARTRAVIVQHTFGNPADLAGILAACAPGGVPVIEDCAHVTEPDDRGAVGSSGVAAFYSYEWGKPVIAGVGGSVTVHDSALAAAMRASYSAYVAPSARREAVMSAQFYAHRVATRLGVTWRLRALYRRLSRMGLMVGSYAVDPSLSPEYDWRMTRTVRRRLPARLSRARLGLPRRRAIAARYRESLTRLGFRLPPAGPTVPLRIPVPVTDKARLLQAAADRRVEVGDWFTTPVHPLEGPALVTVGYRPGSCPNAEWAASHVITFPVRDSDTLDDVEAALALLTAVAAPATAVPAADVPAALSPGPVSWKEAPPAARQTPVSLKQAPPAPSEGPVPLEQAAGRRPHTPVPLEQAPPGVAEGPVSLKHATGGPEGGPVPLKHAAGRSPHTPVPLEQAPPGVVEGPVSLKHATGGPEGGPVPLKHAAGRSPHTPVPLEQAPPGVVEGPVSLKHADPVDLKAPVSLKQAADSPRTPVSLEQAHHSAAEGPVSGEQAGAGDPEGPVCLEHGGGGGHGPVSLEQGRRGGAEGPVFLEHGGSGNGEGPVLLENAGEGGVTAAGAGVGGGVRVLGGPFLAGQLRVVAEMHKSEVAHGFLSSLGVPVLEMLYEHVASSRYCGLFVAEMDGRPVGYICGSLDTSALFREFLRRRWWVAGPALLPRLLTPRRILRAVETLRYPSSATEGDLPAAEVINFVVRPGDRGTGVADQLFERLMTWFAERGVDAVKIVTGEQQGRAHGFYEKHGAELRGRLTIHRGGSSRVYRYQVKSALKGTDAR